MEHFHWSDCLEFSLSDVLGINSYRILSTCYPWCMGQRPIFGEAECEGRQDYLSHLQCLASLNIPTAAHKFYIASW